jgi:hypothetical protein
MPHTTPSDASPDEIPENERTGDEPAPSGKGKRELQQPGAASGSGNGSGHGSGHGHGDEQPPARRRALPPAEDFFYWSILSSWGVQD